MELDLGTPGSGPWALSLGGKTLLFGAGLE